MMMVMPVLAIFFFLLGLPAHAQIGEWQNHESGAIRLIASTNIMPGDALTAGLHLKLNPGWHAYWRSPGDAGLPPSPEWKDSVNLQKTELLFPWPQRFALQGLETYGYDGEVVFPVKVTKIDQGAAVDLKAKLTLLVCSDVCIPADFNLSLAVPANFRSPGAGVPDEATELLGRFIKRVPKQDDGQGLSLVSAALSEKDGVRFVAVQFSSQNPINTAELVGEIGDGSTLTYSNARLDAEHKSITLTLTKDAPKDLAGKELTFTLIDTTNQSAVEKKLMVTSATTIASASPTTAPIAASPTPMPNIWAMVVLALLGGLVLNLMPCVLPVLALKSLSFIKHGGGTASGVRLSFLATSAGIIFSFLVMAGIIIGLKHVGMSVGWGVQFQNPYFLIVLIAILILFALNLLGLFEIPLPRLLADRLSWTQGHGSLTKDFFSGAFATVLATPCTAPFLGTAVGFALAGGTVEILVIFLALGVGLAAPFLLIALFPKTATLLPKPGAWMEKVRKVLGILLALTALWLGSVLYSQVAAPAHSVELGRAEAGGWETFDEQKIPQLVADGKIIYVDVTADWCLTCQVNKKLVLDTPDIQAVLTNPRIVKMKADWTKRDETIGAYLKTFMRYGIPFNVIYSQAVPHGEPLPELLSKNTVLQGLKKAGL